jgi:preprotein translocase subunit SecG
MELVVLILHIFAAVVIIGLVLIQHGKGADVGAAFGSGSSGSIFGSSGSANFLSRATAVVATLFFLTSMGLTYFSARKSDHEGVMANQPASPADALQGQPVVPAPVSPAPADPASRAGDVPK